MDRVSNFLRAASDRGIRLWSSNGKLHYSAPKGVLAVEDLEMLRAHKNQVLSLLDQEALATTEPPAEVRGGVHRAPLAYSQLSHWRTYRLHERPAMRQIASATRLRGRLRIHVLEECIAAIVRQQDALRTRVIINDGMPVQEVAEQSARSYLDLLSIKATSGDDTEIASIARELILQPIDVATGPLFGTWLLRVDEDEHVLIMAMEHMISDAHSMGLLLRDLSTAYAQSVQGRQILLPAVEMQFSEFAIQQRNADGAGFANQHREWIDHLAKCPRTRFPADREAQLHARSGWGYIPIRVESSMRTALREWCRVRRTTLPMCFFTVYAALVMRWCGTSDTVIQYQSDGRVSPETENTIGFFAAALYLPVALRGHDSFLDLLAHVTDEYCRAHDHADFSFFAAQLPRPGFTRNALFNWVPQGQEVRFSDLSGDEHAFQCSSVRLGHPILSHVDWDYEPAILLYDAEDGISGSLFFPRDRFADQTMERFRQNLMIFLIAMLGQPAMRIQSLALAD